MSSQLDRPGQGASIGGEDVVLMGCEVVQMGVQTGNDLLGQRSEQVQGAFFG
jgi:hypothetical protein